MLMYVHWWTECIFHKQSLPICWPLFCKIQHHIFTEINLKKKRWRHMSWNDEYRVKLVFDNQSQSAELLAQKSDPTFLALLHVLSVRLCLGVARWTSLCWTAVLIKSSHIDNSAGYPLTHTCIGQTNVARQLEPRQSKHSWQKGGKHRKEEENSW